MTATLVKEVTDDTSLALGSSAPSQTERMARDADASNGRHYGCGGIPVYSFQAWFNNFLNP